MRQDPNFKKALKISYQLLSYRPRSTYEIKTKLDEKGFDNGTIEEVVGHLKRLRYLDDKNFAKLWVETRMKVKPVGSLLMRKDLKDKGLNEGLIEEAIKEGQSDYDEFETAMKIAKKRLNFYGKIHKLKAKKRIYDYLVRRGFKFDVVRRVLNEMW